MVGEALPSELIEVTVRLPRATVEQSLRATRAHGSRLGLAQALLAGRRSRSSLLKGLRFAEPLWDMILEIYVAAAGGRHFNVLKLCALSGGSVTTALRYIKQLESNGYLSRQADATDARSFIVVMQPALRSAVERWLDQLAETMP